MITDTAGLTWGVVVGAANQADGAVASKVVEPLLGYLDCIKNPSKSCLQNNIYEMGN